MTNDVRQEKQELQNSQYLLRKIIGYLGIFLPIIILIVHQELLSSISHYYYTKASMFFIGILFTFGLILIAYKGYPEDKTYKKERFTDDRMSTLAGILIIIAVIVPTDCGGSLGSLTHCDDDYLFGYCNHKGLNAIHLIGAGGFLCILGIMCITKFTRSDYSDSKKRHGLYRFCGYTVLGCVGLIFCLFIAELIVQYMTENENFTFNILVPGYTFILETIAVWAFGVAWLDKGEIEKDFASLKSKFFK